MVKEKGGKLAPTLQKPAQQHGRVSKKFGKSDSFFNRCFKCNEIGHRSYECPKKKAELHLLEEEGDVDQEPIYNEEVEDDNAEYCEGN